MKKIRGCRPVNHGKWGKNVGTHLSFRHFEHWIWFIGLYRTKIIIDACLCEKWQKQIKATSKKWMEFRSWKRWIMSLGRIDKIAFLCKWVDSEKNYGQISPRCIQFLKLFLIFYWLVFGLFLIQFWLILLILLGHFYKYFGSMFHRILGLFRPDFVHFWNIFHQSWSILTYLPNFWYILDQFLVNLGPFMSRLGHFWINFYFLVNFSLFLFCLGPFFTDFSGTVRGYFLFKGPFFVASGFWW